MKKSLQENSEPFKVQHLQGGKKKVGGESIHFLRVNYWFSFVNCISPGKSHRFETITLLEIYLTSDSLSFKFTC